MSAEQSSQRPRVCVIDSKEVGLAYERLDECQIDVMGALPSVAHLTAKVASAYDVVIVGCNERLLLNPAFDARVRQASRGSRLVAVMPDPTPGSSAQAARIGFAGLVARDVSPRALDRTIAAVTRGERAFPRDTSGALVDLAFGPAAGGGTSSGPSLTPRQEQVVALIARGATDREIAALLRISHSTAHKHVQNALRRFKAKTRSQLVAATRLATTAEPPSL